MRLFNATRRASAKSFQTADDESPALPCKALPDSQAVGRFRK